MKGAEDVADSLPGTDKEIAEIEERHKDMTYRISFAYMKNVMDTEDIIQDTFYNLIRSGTVFENSEHEKAWIIRTATNLCKNALSHWWRKREYVDDYEALGTAGQRKTRISIMICTSPSFQKMTSTIM